MNRLYDKKNFGILLQFAFDVCGIDANWPLG